jgi:TetR/AcrR family fatty acid metabolism transcriptional regulator
MTAEESPEEKVTALVHAIFYDAARNRNFFLAYTDLAAHAARSRTYREVSIAFRSLQHATFKGVIRLGVEEGQFHVQDVDEAATVLRAMIDGLSMQWVQESDWRRLHAVYRQVCLDSLLAYLGIRVP